MKHLVFVTGALAALAACNPSTPKFVFEHQEQRATLANGLRLIVMPDPSTKLVEVDVRWEVGSREDPEGKAGLAHLVEHLMFQLKPDGPTTPPLMHFVGQISTFFNAYTNWDSTHYMTTALAENLDKLVQIEAMRMHFGCQTISEDEFLREREVVRNEIRQRGGTAEGQVPQLVLSSVYPSSHAYARMIGGDDKNLTSISLKDACDFIGSYYVPERATVIVAGGVTLDQVKASAEKWLTKLPKKAGGPRKNVAAVASAPGKKVIDLDVERPMVIASWPVPNQFTEEGESVMFGLFSAFFGVANAASRWDFATDVSPMMLGGAEAPVFSIIVELKSAGRLEEALDFIRKETRKAYRGFDEGSWQMIEEAKNRNKADFIKGLEELSSRTNQVGELVQFDKTMEFAGNTRPYLFHALDKFERYDGQKIARAIKKYVDPDKATIVVIRANKEGLKGDTRAKVSFQTKSHDQIESPEVDPAEAKVPMKVGSELKLYERAERFTMGNGMQVVLLPNPGMPLVSAQLLFRVGDAMNPDSPGLASASADFLSSAMADIDMSQDALARTGTHIDCSAGQDFTSCDTSGVNIYLDVMIKGLERHVRAGETSQAWIESWQKSKRTSAQSESAMRQQEIARQWAKAMYGEEHPYAKTAVVTAADASKIGKDRVVKFRGKHYSAGNAILVVAGNFDVERARKLAKDVFGGWSKGFVDAPVPTERGSQAGARYVGVVGKAEPQMAVRIGYPAPAGIDSQESARQIIADMLNRRMGDIRFKLGATYGTYAGRQTRQGPSVYQMGGTVDADRAGEALRAMRDGVESLRRGDNFDVDFVRARRTLVTDMLGGSTSSGTLADNLAWQALFNLPAEHENKLLQQVAAASTAQVKKLIAEELKPENEVIVLSADRATLEKAFAAAGIKDFVLVEPTVKK